MTDDLVQDVFLKVYLNLDTFEENAALKTWLYRIAINQCKDYFRSWHHRKVRLARTLDIFEKTSDQTPEEHALKKDENIAISQVIFAMNRKYREVTLLHYYRDFSLEEIASLLELNPSTVRSRLHRARAQLKKKLGGEIFES